MSTYKEDSKKFSIYTDDAVKCKCGKTVLMPSDRKICSWCGNYVYKTKEAEFKYKLASAMKVRLKNDKIRN